MILRASALLAASVLFLWPQASRAGTSAEGSLSQLVYSGYSLDGSSVTIATSGEAKLRLDFAASDVVRVWLAPTGSFRKEPSYAVSQESWPKLPMRVADKGDYLSLQTSRLALRINKAPLRLDMYQADDATPILLGDASRSIQWRADGSLSVFQQLHPSEHFYGLGQDNKELLGTLDRRGTRRELWTGQSINHGKVTADIPIPFLLSTGGSGGGYGLFFDNSYRSEFDLGSSSQEFYAWHASGGEALYYFIYGPDFEHMTERYTELTGRPSLPSLWTLGYLQSKCSYKTWEEIDDVIRNLRAKDIPVDGIAFDFDWAEEIQNFRWNARWNGESSARLSEYAAQGVKFFLSQSGPMIRKSSSNYQDGLQHNIFATDGQGKTVTCGYYGGDLMDFTSANMKPWLWPQLEPLHHEGIKGWWLDLTEPEGEPATTVYQGGNAAKIHNVFSLLVSKTYYEMLQAADPDARVFLLTRTGFAGIQKYGAALWTGDIYSDYDTFTAQVPAMLNAGLSGITAWTNDSGGFLEGYYKNNLVDHGLLYERWMQFSAFAPITRAHHVGLSEPYAFGADVEEGSRHYLKLRYQLLPYIYSYAWHTHKTGAPFVRPLIFDYQDDPKVTNLKDEFLFGKELLVAPVLTEGVTSRSVYLPAGTWIGYEDGIVFEGGRGYHVAAPQHRIPLFVKAGAIIPLAPPVQNTDEPWEPLTVEVFPAGISTFTMYADDGHSMAFDRERSYTETRLRSDFSDGQNLSLSIEASNAKFLPQTYIARLHLPRAPRQVTADARPLPLEPTLEGFTRVSEGAFWDRATRSLQVKVKSRQHLSHLIQAVLVGDSSAKSEAEGT